MANPFQNVVSPPADTWVNRLFGPPIAVQTQQYQAMEDERQRQRDESILGPAARKAFEMRSANPNLSPAQVLLQLQGTPEGQSVFNAGPDYIKKLSESIQTTVPGQTQFLQAGNTIFGSAPNNNPAQQNQLYVAGEGGDSRMMTLPNGNTVPQTTQGQAFPPGYMGGTQPSYSYPSPTGETSSAPNVKWWVPAAQAPDGLNQLFAAAGAKYGLPADMLSSQSFKESRFNPQAVSPKGASGISQFMPDTAKQYGIDPFNVEQSIDAQAKHDAYLLQKYQGNYRYALMAYNWGEGNVDEWLQRGAKPAEIPDETVDYVRTITGETAPLPNIEYRPGMSLQKTAQATLPTNKDVSTFDLDRLGNRNPAIYFAGVGLAPFVTEVGKEIGAQIDPSVANEWTSQNHVSRNYLRNLSASLNAYAVATNMGGGRLKGPLEAWMKLDPSAGGVINDPVDAIDTAISLYDLMSDRIEELSGKNVYNTPKANLDNYEKEKDAAQRILQQLPTRDQMTEMRGEFVKRQHVMTPAVFMDKAKQYVPGVVSSGAQMIQEGLNSTMAQPSQPAGPSVASTAAPTGAPTIKAFGRDPKTGKLIRLQ